VYLPHGGRIWHISWSPDGEKIATASNDQTVKVWDPVTGENILTLRGHTDQVEFVTWHPDGVLLASTGYDSNVILWDTTKGIMTKKLDIYAGREVRAADFSPNGRFLAAAGQDDTSLVVYDLLTDKTISIGNVNDVTSVQWASDGERIAVAMDDGVIAMVSAASGEMLFSVKAHSAFARSLVWSPDGRRLASGGKEGAMKIHDALTGEELLAIHGHEELVFTIAWSPDGTRIATGSFDEYVRVWDASNGYRFEAEVAVGKSGKIDANTRLDDD
jgi:WD40 repeat protein